MNTNASAGHAGFDNHNNTNCYANVPYNQTASMRHCNPKTDTLLGVPTRSHQHRFRVGHPQLHPLDTDLFWRRVAENPAFPPNPSNQTAPISTRPVRKRVTSRKPQPRAKISTELRREIYFFHRKNKGLNQAKIGAHFNKDRSTISKILSNKRSFLTPDEMCVADIEDKLIAWTQKYPSSSINQIREQVRYLCQNTTKISAQLKKKLESTTSLETFQREHRFDDPFIQPSEPFVLHCNTSSASPQECLLGFPYAVPQKGNEISGSYCFSDFVAKDASPFINIPIPCGDKGVKSEFCQVPATTSSALELPPINSYAVPPTFSQICDNDYTTSQSTDFVFNGAGCGESGHGEDAKCWNNSNYRAWVGLPSHVQVSYL